MFGTGILRWVLQRRLRISQKADLLYDEYIHPNPQAPTQKRSYQISCVQREIRLVRNQKEYIERIESFVQQASEQGSDLVVFPEYNFFDLLGLIPGFRLIHRFANQKAKKAVGMNQKAKKITSVNKEIQHEGSDTTDPSILYSIFALIAKPTEAFILSIMTRLARKYQINIYTGSYLCKEGDQIYNAGSLISRDGHLVGTQKKIHLTDFESDIGLCRADQLHIYSLDIGKLAFPVCMDATYFETFRLARNLGADLVIIPIANQEEYNVYKAMRGIWPRVQESYVYGVKAALTGWLAGMHFTGKAGLFAPIAITENQDGVIAISKEPEGNKLVTGMIDLDQLERARQESEYHGDVNPCFEKDYVMKTYGQ